ncbi:MAG: alpha-amylase [Erysipelothrix sp.]|nr:alpha-amylase [Erysipelothrix sp.]
MKSLKKIKQHLIKEKATQKTVFNYVIPDVWNAHQVSENIHVVGDGNLMVNPYDFLIDTIDYITAQTDLRHMNFTQPYYNIHHVEKNLTGGDWIRKSVAYSSMIRTSTSYDHDRSGELNESNIYQLKETGTFVKTLMILPMLKKMGVDVLYLLPITKYSKKDKKGELGSPYGVKNFFELEDSLKDPLTGDKSTTELEFKALVEACHIMDIKVVIDIIPRTNSRHSDYILDHPEWFYWINVEAKDGYHPPVVDKLGPSLVPKEEYFGDLFQSEDVVNHLKQFVLNPKEQDSIKWANLVATVSDKTDVLGLIESTFGCTVAFAFSDHINDPQPAWNDVTYFRMYMDHPVNSQPYLDNLDFEVAPYLLFDIAKSSLNPGSVVNTELWELISNIIPYFQEEYGIDGARIDMGHALPKELVAQIVRKARLIDPNFTFIAEELDIRNAGTQKEYGYNMIIGDGFMQLPRISDGSFNRYVYGAQNVALPVFACGETHDSPRLASRAGGKVVAQMITLFNYFIPNAIPFINSGQEFYEDVPMNTGLDVNSETPYVGKLALFDYYSFNTSEYDRFEIIEKSEQVVAIRNQYLDAMLDRSRTYSLTFEHPGVQSAAFAYRNEKSILVAIANTDFIHDQTHRVFLIPIPDRFKSNVSIKEVFASSQPLNIKYALDEYQSLWVPMKKGEVKLIEITLE